MKILENIKYWWNVYRHLKAEEDAKLTKEKAEYERLKAKFEK